MYPSDSIKNVAIIIPADGYIGRSRANFPFDTIVFINSLKHTNLNLYEQDSRCQTLVVEQSM
jgi:hypothetical protein